MENRDSVRQDDKRADTNDEGTWVLALRENGVGYFGKVIAIDGEAEPQGELTQMRLFQALSITLSPVYDYREMVKDIPILDPKTGKMMADPNMPGIPAMQPMRTPLVMPVGFTLVNAPLHLNPARYDFRLLSEMDRRDAETLRNFGRETDRGVASARAEAAGIQLAGPDELAAVRARRGNKT